jgi:hypothetical protein
MLPLGGGKALNCEKRKRKGATIDWCQNTGAGTADAENTPIPSTPIPDISPPISTSSETSFAPTPSPTPIDPLRIVEVTAAIVGAVAALVGAAFALARWKNKN